MLEAEDPTNKGKLDRFYDEIIAKYPQSEETAIVLQKRGQAAFEKKDFPKAVKCWSRFVGDFPKHKDLAQVRTKLETAKLVVGGDKSKADALECANLLQRADALFDRASYQQAIPLYQEIVNKHALSQEASQAAGRLAQSLQAEGKNKEALAVLQCLVDKSPQGAAKALGEIVIKATNSKMESLRVQATQQLIDRYSETFEAQQALFIAGSHAMARKNRTEAEKWWNMLLDRYPETEFRSTVEKKLGISQGNEKPDKKIPVVLTKEEIAKKKKEDFKRWEREAGEFEQAYRNQAATVEEKAQNAYDWAERCFCLEQYDRAVHIYQRIWDEFPDSSLADQAAFRTAQVLFAANQTQKGIEQSLFLINRFPKSRLRPFVIFCLGNRCVLYEGDLKKAWQYYEQLMKEYPQDALTDQARKFWAKLQKLPPEKLKQQVADFIEKRRKRG